jgi:hypothetical protein
MRTPLHSLAGVAVRAALVLCAVAPAAHAHAIHTTVTQVTVDDRGVTLMIRTFADDISATVARHAGRPAPGDYSLPAADLLRYVRTQFMIGNTTRGMLALEPCGIRRAEDMYWLCFRVPAARGLAGLSVRNQMLTEFHADQINIVQLDDRGRKQTMLFRKGSAPSTVNAGA